MNEQEHQRRELMIGVRKDGRTLREIAEMFGISHQRVSQIIGSVPIGRTKKPRYVKKKAPDDIRFLRRVRFGSANDCWEWTGALSKGGYGRGHADNACIYAHQYSYKYFVGPIADGLWVLHHCDNPRCVNPHHLFLGTPADNSHDRDAKGRGRYRPITPETRAEVARLRAQGMYGKDIAAMLGISMGSVYKIAQGLIDGGDNAPV